MHKNYLSALTRLLNKRNWHSVLLWKMIDLIVEELIQSHDDELSQSVWKEIYRWARKCKSPTELEDFLDEFSVEPVGPEPVGPNIDYDP